jgi:hypothetical protein
VVGGAVGGAAGPVMGTGAGEGDWGMGPAGLPLPDLERLFDALASLPGALLGPGGSVTRGSVGPPRWPTRMEGDGAPGASGGGGRGGSMFPPSAVPVPVFPEGRGGGDGAGGTFV